MESVCRNSALATSRARTLLNMDFDYFSLRIGGWITHRIVHLLFRHIREYGQTYFWSDL